MNSKISKLEARLNCYSHFTTDTEFSLDSIKALCLKLNNIQDNVPSIHVAGTNGKGSVSLFMASIIAKSGKKVGFSLSPHLSRVNERIIIDGYPAKDNIIESNLDIIEKAISEAKLDISFFELMLSLAFLSFKDLDYAVYEVGLGGRLDATNVLKKPNISILTSVGLDHQKFLGNTLEDITREKIGIMRPDSMFVTGELNDSCFQITKKKANSLNTDLHSLGRHFTINTDRDSHYIEDEKGRILINSSLKGEHQLKNAAIAAKASSLLGFDISNIEEGLNSAFMPARLETFKYNNRDLILDCAHNPNAFTALRDYLKSQRIDNIDIIFSSLATKDWKSMINLIKDYIVNWYIVKVDSQRAEEPENIVNYIRELGKENIYNFGRDYISSAIELTKNKSSRKILVTGSMYFVGEFRASLNLEEKSYW